MKKNEKLGEHELFFKDFVASMDGHRNLFI